MKVRTYLESYLIISLFDKGKKMDKPKFEYDKLIEMIDKANNIAIFTHLLPDGDAVGSSCAVATYLRSIGKNATVYMPAPVLDEYKYFDVDSLISYNKPTNFDLIITTDCDRERVADFNIITGGFNNIIAIDHHKTFCPFATLNFVNCESSSACELVYDIFEKCKFKINKTVAEFLYLGILRDTGGFMHSCTTPHTLRIAAELLEYGIDAENINRHFMMRITYKNAMLLKVALNNLNLFGNKRIAISSISKKDLAQYDAKVDDTGGVISHILSIDSVEIAVLITEASNNVHKISFRSKYDVDVSDIAKDFGGGGHAKASGCQMYGKIENIISSIKKSIEKRLIK